MKTDLSEETPHVSSTDNGIPLSRRPKMVVFGGSFDPVHIGHLFLAGEIIRAGLVDEVLFVPARRPPHKIGTVMSKPEDRLNMLTIALEPYAEFSMSDIEIRREAGLSYTIDTLEMLNQLFPDHRLNFLMGMDSLENLHTWHRATELVQRYDFLVYPRASITPPSYSGLAGHFGNRNARKLLDSVLPMNMIPVTATTIRELCAADKNLAGQIPESVLGYIKEHGLYEKQTLDEES